MKGKTSATEKTSGGEKTLAREKTKRQATFQ